MEAIGIESSEVAVRDAVRNAKRNGIENVHFWTGEAAEVLRDRLGLGSRDAGAAAGSADATAGSPDAGSAAGDGPTIDSVLVDPPRAGLHPGVVSRLIRLGAPKLVYVSCNPSTLGRDLALLCESRYRVRWIQPVDMFPNTPHIECVATLDREDG
jgi:tRNA/tmRNA/rRNA uracil-C5-methylase (TrmA/RlmC/RlmD family)